MCLAMVLAYFGRPRMLAQCRVACDPGRDGLTAADLVDAARVLGLYARDWVVQGADTFCDSRFCPRLHLPAIVYWQGRHFVVRRARHSSDASPSLTLRLAGGALRVRPSIVAVLVSR